MKPEPDPILEALKKEEAKRKEEAKKQDEAKKREEAKRREEAKKRDEAKREENKFDFDRIQTALLDKRVPQRQVVTGSMVNPAPSLGTSLANASVLSQNEIDALRAQLYGCWNPPVGVLEAKDLLVTVQILAQPRRFAFRRAVRHQSRDACPVPDRGRKRAPRRPPLPALPAARGQIRCVAGG